MGIFNGPGIAATRRTSGTVTKTTGASDPIITLTEDLYRTKSTGKQESVADGSTRVLVAKSGTTMRQSQLDALFPKPSDIAISPGTVAAAGGTLVTITGRDLDGTTSVTLKGVAATALSIKSPEKLTCVSAAVAAGTGDIVVVHPHGNTTVTNGVVVA